MPIHNFAIESFGVKVAFTSNRKHLLARVRGLIERSLLGQCSLIAADEAEYHFYLDKTRDGYTAGFDDEDFGESFNLKILLNYFESRVTLIIAEYATDFVFVHSGVVGWKGKAIVIPGRSHDGKTTLVAELVKQGAVYYSDEYALFDKNGHVHPFARPLAMRDREQPELRKNITAQSLGGNVGTVPLPLGMLVLTKFKSNANWRPRKLSPGVGVMEMLMHTFPTRVNTQFTLKVLKKAVGSAIIIESVRGDAKIAATNIINFVDKTSKEAKLL